MFDTKLILTIFFLKQIDAIEFSHHPEDVLTVEGSNVAVTCVISGNIQDHELSWLRYGTKITEGRHFIVSDDFQTAGKRIDINPLSGASTYYGINIQNVQYVDKGEYACAVNQNGREIRSQTGTLTVHQIPEPIYPICDHIVSPVREGTRVNLKSKGEAIDPPVKLRLSKSVTDINTDTEVLKNQRTTPIIHSFIADPSANNVIFICQLTTPADQSIIRNCSIGPLNVWYKPNVTIQHAGKMLSGREAIFICQTNANPPVINFTWQFDPPLNIDRYDVDDIGQIMRILRVTIRDNGLIVKCTARNTVDQVTHRVTMEVIGPENKEKPKTNAIESVDDKQSDKKSVSLPVLLAGVSVLVLVIVFAIIIPVYYFCICSKKEGTVVAQPDVYFEPLDRLTLPLPNKRHSVLWRRSFGAQVPTDRDVDAMYLEIQSDHYIFTPDSRGNTLPY